MELEQFIADCKTAVTDRAPTKAVREVVERAVADPAALLKALGTPERGGVNRIHVSDDLTLSLIHISEPCLLYTSPSPRDRS